MKVRDLIRELTRHNPDYDVRVVRADGSGAYDIANHVQAANFGYFGTGTRLDNFNTAEKEPDSIVVIYDKAMG